MDVRKKKMTSFRFPILFASDVGYAPHLAGALYSLLENNQSLLFEINLFTSGIPVKDIAKLEKICSQFATPLKVVRLRDSWFDGLILNHHFKKANYYRLFAADLISADRCLYLDADTIVTGSISELMDLEIGDCYLAAVENPGFDRHKELGMQPASRYFNSGMMLLNLKKWRANDLKDLVVAFVREKPEAIHFVDQCGLNSIVDGDWFELDSKYNYQSVMLTSDFYESCGNEIKPVIVHFTGSSKPWHMNNKHPFKQLYWSYRNKTPYKSLVPDDFSLSSLARYLLPGQFKAFIKKSMEKTV